MRTLPATVIALLLLSSCGTLQEATAVKDDVYDIPDRNISVSAAPVAPEPETAPAPEPEEDYYDANEASRYQQGSYWDRTYNDPSWYNRDRFGFGFNSSPWGSSWGMSYGTGWGNGWAGGMGMGWGNGWYNSPTGWYNPYWGNSWMSGYGYYNPWNGGIYDPWPYYGGWNNGWNNCWNCGMYGNYWGGWNQGWGNCWGCGGWNNPWNGWGGWHDGGQVVVRHRPGFGGSGGGTGGATTQPRLPRSVPGLLQHSPDQVKRGTRPAESRPNITPNDRPRPDRNDRLTKPARPERETRPSKPARERNDRPSRPSRPSFGGDNGSPSFERGGGSRGGGGGSSPSPSPRPRR